MPDETPSVETRRAADLKPGDMIDLEGDKFADPNRDHVAFQCEYGVVAEVDRETPECVAVYVDGVDSFGFPPDHLIRWVGHDSGYGV